MKTKTMLQLAAMFVFPAYAFAYNYGSLVDLPDAVKKLLPQNPDIIASASADLNGDNKQDYAVIIQYKDNDSDNEADAKRPGQEPRRGRELLIITAKSTEYLIAARSKRAVLCSACGAEGEDPFLGLKALSKSFTILHKFGRDSEEAWGTAAKFGYSKRDNKWQLVYFSGAGDAGMKPEDFGLINLEDFDINFYMASGKIEARPDTGEKPALAQDEILFTENGAMFAIKPDKTGFRYVAGDRYFHKIGFPCISTDRKEIAFIRNNDMYVMDAYGKNEKQLFRDVIKIFSYDYKNEGTIYDMKWSPDEKYFAITGIRKNNDYNHSCFYIRGQDGVTKTVKECGKDEGINYICFSPDSSKLAYYRGITLAVMDVSSGVEKQLFIGQYRAGLSWSKDGNRLLTVADGGYGIIDAGNGSLSVIKCRASAGYGPLFWSKDEKSALYYTSDYIFTTPLEEGGEMKIVTGPSYGGLIDGLAW